MLLNFQPFLAMFAGQKEKPAVLGQHFTQTDNTDCYLLNWRLSAMSSPVGTGLGRKTTHRQAHCTSQGGPVTTHHSRHLCWAGLSDVKEPVNNCL